MPRPNLGRPRADELQFRRLDELCAFEASRSTPHDRGFWFVQLVAWLRGADSGTPPESRLGYLAERLRDDPARHARFKQSLSSVVADWDLVELLAYGGIARDFHLAGAIKEWLTYRLLPDACDARQAVSLLLMAFEEGDVKWLSNPGLAELAAELMSAEQRERLLRALSEAQLNLSHQLYAQAHSPAIAGLSRADNSAFQSLHSAVEALLEEPTEDRRYERLFGLFARCRMEVGAQERKLALRGADLNTTFQLDRMFQQLTRLHSLARMNYEATPAVVGRTFASVVSAIQRNTNGRRLLRRSSQLWMKNLVDTAAAVGGRYLEEDQSSWRAALRAGAGGGLLMAFATVFKYQLASLELPIVYQGLAFGLNYALTFCAVYLMHFSIATKLPANTAAALAKCVHEDRGHLQRARRFLSVWRATLRLQVAGLLGNLLVAAPAAYLLDVLSVVVFKRHIFDRDTTMHVLDSTSVLGPSPLYAALTGALLWLSSLAAAAVDNWTRVARLAARLSTNLAVLRKGGRASASQLAAKWVPKLGGLSGNVVLGFLLGCVPSFFAILHLGIDIRHVTVSAASCALAAASGTAQAFPLGMAAAGVLVIGAVNVAVSFTLALHVAMEANARDSRSTDSRLIVRAALRRWARGKSTDTLRPVQKQLPPAHLDSGAARPM